MAAKTEVTGVVVRDKMAKSRIVAVERQVRHETYGKAQRLTSTFMAHDEQNETRVGRQGGDGGEPPAVGPQALGDHPGDLAGRQGRRGGRVNGRSRP